MGSLRTLLALTVVFAHCEQNMFVGARNAVQLFYMISGFLISYILVERKAYPDARDFYVNRGLRLYPIYGVVALLSLGLHLASRDADFLDVYRHAPPAAIGLLAVSNLTLLGQDWVLFAGTDHGSLVFTTDFRTSPIALYRGLLVPQAWSLGVELSFYLIAPFVLRRRKAVIALLLLSAGLRLLLIAFGPGLQDPWTYRFFPTELALFLLGALAHQWLLPFYRRQLGSALQRWCPPVTACLLLLAGGYGFLPLDETAKTMMLLATAAALMPFAFLFQGGNRIDQRIGDLSYPIYIGHLFVIAIVDAAAARLGWTDKRFVTDFDIALSVGFALLLNAVVGSRVEQIRAGFRRPAAAC